MHEFFENAWQAKCERKTLEENYEVHKKRVDKTSFTPNMNISWFFRIFFFYFIFSPLATDLLESKHKAAGWKLRRADDQITNQAVLRCVVERIEIGIDLLVYFWNMEKES